MDFFTALLVAFLFVGYSVWLRQKAYTEGFDRGFRDSHEYLDKEKAEKQVRTVNQLRHKNRQ